MLAPMSTSSHALLVGKWIAASLLTGVVTGGLAHLNMYLFACAGLIGGALQWTVLRPSVLSARSWILACALGLLLGLLVGGGVWLGTSMTLTLMASPVLGSAAITAINPLVLVGGLVAALVVGAVQARALGLSRDDRRAWMGWSAGAFALVAPYWWETLFLVLESPVSAVAHGAVQGLLYGAVTAGGLSRLSANRRDDVTHDVALVDC